MDGVRRAFELISMTPAPSIPLPGGWHRLTKNALLHAISLARAALVEFHSGLENNPLVRVQHVAKIARLRARVAPLEEMMRIKDNRMGLIPVALRPHYPPEERLAILTLRAAEGWNAGQTAREFLLTAPTVASWMRRLDAEGPDALVRTPEPVSRFPDFVALLVQKLKTALPSMGKVRIAQVLARAGLVLSASTVRRLAERRLALPEPPGPRASKRRLGGDERVVTAKRPHHLWHIDMTVVPTGLGFWLPWFPFSVVVGWPFCFWVAAVVDHFSRAVVAKRAFPKEPSGAEICALLDRAVRCAGCTPQHIVSDQGAQFRGEYSAWCAKNGAKPRFGTLGEHGSIAVIERFWRSMKHECFRRIIVPMSLGAFERELEAYIGWYNDFRVHRALGGRTPGEVRDGLAPAREPPALEPRARYPLIRAGPARRRRRRLRGRLEISIGHSRSRAHLPIIELRRAA